MTLTDQQKWDLRLAIYDLRFDPKVNTAFYTFADHEFMLWFDKKLYVKETTLGETRAVPEKMIGRSYDVAANVLNHLATAMTEMIKNTELLIGAQ